jgi:hypothetical protein
VGHSKRNLGTFTTLRRSFGGLLAVAGVVASAAPVNAQKACETVHAQVAMEEWPERVDRTAHPLSVLKGIIAASPAPSLSGSLNLDIVL